MEILLSSSEAEERAMVDPEMLALKRARSPSPEGSDGGRQLVAAPKKGPRPARSMRKDVKGQRLLLLPASPSTDAQVRHAKPCMFTSSERDGSGMGDSSPTKSVMLVNVPVVGGGKRSEGLGVKNQGLRSTEEGEGKTGAGGPLRREKGKGIAVLSRSGASVRKKKNRVGGGVGGRQGEEVSVGEVRGLKAPAPASPSSGNLRGVKGRKKGATGCWGSGTDPGVVALSPSAESEVPQVGVTVRTGGAVDSPSPGGGMGKARGRSGGKGSPTVASPISRVRSRSPVRRKGNLFGGRTHPVGRNGGEDEQVNPGHGDLVKKIKGAVREAEGGGGTVVEGGGDPGEPSEQ